MNIEEETGLEEYNFLKEQIDKLAKYILEYFPYSITSEGACLTAIAIMEEQRNNLKEIVEDLNEIEINDGYEPYDFVVIKKKWEERSK